jgi:hypothetical protein
VLGQIEQGQLYVLNDHVESAASGFPDVSVTPLLPPRTTAV